MNIRFYEETNDPFTLQEMNLDSVESITVKGSDFTSGLGSEIVLTGVSRIDVATDREGNPGRVYIGAEQGFVAVEPEDSIEVKAKTLIDDDPELRTYVRGEDGEMYPTDPHGMHFVDAVLSMAMQGNLVHATIDTMVMGEMTVKGHVGVEKDQYVFESDEEGLKAIFDIFDHDHERVVNPVLKKIDIEVID